MKIYKILGFIFLILIALESGLQLKALLKNQSSSSKASESGVSNVLIIGDSVFGNSGEPFALFTQLQKRIEEHKKMNVHLIDASSKANYSAQANFEADELIKKYKPELSIVLLGGSDFFDLKPDSSGPVANSINYIKNFIYKTYLYKLTVSLSLQMKMSLLKNSTNELMLKERARSIKAFNEQEKQYKRFVKKELTCSQIARLADARASFVPKEVAPIITEAERCVELLPKDSSQASAYYDIARAYRVLKKSDKTKEFLHKALPYHLHPEDIHSMFFWLALEKMDCPEMFNSYDKALSRVEPDRRMLWMMRRCFAEYNKNEEGAKYFAELAPKLKDSRNMALLMSQSLIQGNQVDLKNIAPGDNDYYISQLQQFRSKSMHAEANKLFLAKDLYIDNGMFKIDYKNYRQLIEKLSAHHKKVIVLQYASQPDWTVLEAIAPLSGDITFISLASIFEGNLKKQSILDLLTDDFIHLSLTGIHIVADELEAQIYEHLK